VGQAEKWISANTMTSYPVRRRKYAFGWRKANFGWAVRETERGHSRARRKIAQEFEIAIVASHSGKNRQAQISQVERPPPAI